MHFKMIRSAEGSLESLGCIKRFFASYSFLLLGLLITVSLGYLLNLIAPEVSSTIPDTVAAKFLLPSAALYPKAHDRFMFLSMIVGGGLALVLFIYFWSNKNLPLPSYLSIFSFSVLAILGLITCIQFPAELPVVFSVAYFDNLRNVLICSILIAGFSLLNFVHLKSSLFLAILMVLIVSLTMTSRIFNESLIDNHAYITSHFEAVIYSIVHIAGGGTCLSDVVAQYGCYGEFLAPLIKITGPSILGITTIFAILQSISLLAITFFASKMIRSRVLLVTALLAIVFLLNFNLSLNSPDHYLQYKPIRLLFPSLSLLWILTLQHRWSKSNLFYSGLFSGLAIVWNLDTGIVVFFALLFFTFVLSVLKEKSTLLIQLKYASKQCLYSLAGTLAFLTVFYFYLEFKSHWTVDLSAAIAYQRDFYLSGVSMLPIPSFPSLWTIPALVIVITLMVSLFYILRLEDRDPKIERALYLGVLAVGLMLYYSGRAHFMVLILVIWPVILLFFFLADSALSSTNKGIRFFVIASLIFFVSAPVVVYYPTWSNIIVYIRTGYEPEHAKTQDDIAFLKSLLSPGERVAILAENQATYHIATKTWPALKGPSIAELLTVKEMDKLNKEIAHHGPKKIIINSPTFPSPLTFSPNLLKLDEFYTLTKQGPGNRLLYYTRISHK